MSDPFSTPRPERRAPVPPPQAVLRRAPAPAAAPALARAADAGLMEAPREAVNDVAKAAPRDPKPAPPREVPRPLPQDFIYDTEHPVLPVPFSAQFGEHRLEGIALSVTTAYVAIGGALDPAWVGKKQLLKLQFDFQGFTISLFAEAIVAGSRQDGEMTLQFMNPAGEHLPQLRYILNSYIAGDFTSLGGMLAYTGPTSPKGAKAAEKKDTARQRVRSAAVAFFSICLIFATTTLLVDRVTQSYEPRPVFIERTGNEMKATTAGQVAYLNPKAKAGEVVFTINANSGDVLNFQLPCDCEVTVTEGIFEGSTVLPIDAILSFFDSTFEVRVRTLMSIEGLGKVMEGEQAYLDVNDGRRIPVDVVMTSATNAAALRGEMFVPVTLAAPPGALGQADLGKSARVRLSKRWFGATLLKMLEKS